MSVLQLRKEHSEFEPVMREFLNSNFTLLKILSIHAANNDAVKRPLGDFEKAFSALINHPHAAKGILLKYDDDLFTVIGTKMTPHFSIAEAMAFVPESMEMAMFESILIEPQASLEQIVAFYSKWALHCSVNSKPRAFQGSFEGVKFKVLDAKKAELRTKSREIVMDPVYALHHHYFIRQLTDRFFYGFASNSVISQRFIRRELIEMAQVARLAPYNLLSLTFINDTEGASIGLGQAVNQSVSTAILSMLLAKELGLSVTEQVNLALVGLMSNVGLIGEIGNLIGKQKELSPDEYQKVVDSQAASVYKLLKAQGKSRPALERLLAIFEDAHEKSGKSIPLTLESRLTRMASQYIALINPRPFRDAYLPYEALRILGKQIATKKAGPLDPILYFFLVQLVGIIPVGSFVQLSTHERAVVYRPRSEKSSRPILKLLGANPTEPTTLVDLSEHPEIQVTKVLDPEREGISVSAYLLKRDS